jgi:hypothetical protein
MRFSSFFCLALFPVAAIACGQSATRSGDGEVAALGNDPAPAPTGSGTSSGGRDGGSATSGPRITAVKALGTGCPNERTWAATIADDGQSATVDLRAYDATVSHGDGLAVADCTLTVSVSSVAGVAAALGSYESDGFASLRGDGVSGEESVKVYVQGNPPASETRVRSFGPSDGGGDYAFATTFGADSPAFGPCGGGRDILVQSRLVLRNNADKSGQGYIKPGTVKLQLQTKPCS